MTYEELLKLTEAGVEIWRPIIGYDFNYQVSNFGNVKRVINNQEAKVTKEIVLHKYKASKGYPFVRLYKNGEAKTTYIHRLIAIAFIPNPYNKPEVDHINTNTEDCRIVNLRWVTHKENANNTLTRKHCNENVYTKSVTRKSLEKRKISNGASAPKTVYQYTLDGKYLGEFFSMEEAERQTGASHICEVLDDNTLSAGGFLWTSNLTDDIQYDRRRDPRIKAVQQYDLDGNLIAEWDSIFEAAQDLNTSTGNICRKIKSSKPRKYRFVYKERVV